MKKAYCRTFDTGAEIHTITEIYPECGINKSKIKGKKILFLQRYYLA
jgi:hypothetical protein